MAEISLEMILMLLDSFIKGLWVSLQLGAMAILLGMAMGLAFAIGQVYGGK